MTSTPVICMCDPSSESSHWADFSLKISWLFDYLPTP